MTRKDLLTSLLVAGIAITALGAYTRVASKLGLGYPKTSTQTPSPESFGLRSGDKDLPGWLWRTMESAPRDGELIEVCSTWGIAPHYELLRWSNITVWDSEAKHVTTDSDYQWRSIVQPSFMEKSGESKMHWRPYVGDPEKYVDPTNGFQHLDEYELIHMIFPTENCRSQYGVRKETK